ncbi:unnamed protein product [Brassica rapa subsp. narinosa]|uniref:(rape) hypothetical protein n=1 Tax=Brassica napus TaxID=3708 RepID=A0A817B4A6_BRANA|nr:unnamed protein product [Brassica napus]
MCKFYLYMETKILIRLNIFDPEDLWKTHGRLIKLLKDFWKTYGRLLEDFDLGGKPKLFQNLDMNHKFY